MLIKLTSTIDRETIENVRVQVARAEEYAQKLLAATRVVRDTPDKGRAVSVQVYPTKK